MSETASSIATNSLLDSRQGANLKKDMAARQNSKKLSGTSSGRQTFDNDEFMAAAIGDTAWLKQSLRSGRDPSLYDRNVSEILQRLTFYTIKIMYHKSCKKYQLLVHIKLYFEDQHMLSFIDTLPDD